MGRLSTTSTGISQSSRELAIGEQRTIAIKDGDGNLIESVHLYRTAREYVYDLCDAYNSREKGNPAVEWVVGADKALHLQNVQSPHGLKKQLEAKAERDRQEFNHRQRYPAGMNAAA
jgi:hypothetical protein